ncbi:hypothetical protein VZT92_027100 [Zoarces viviparus]|uniref:C2H2-type domain-containing protein n=1 Tax=Zoarces viviparus TaxID=48416 RepID=A0AAW1DTM6_ZOAVI
MQSPSQSNSGGADPVTTAATVQPLDTETGAQPAPGQPDAQEEGNTSAATAVTERVDAPQENGTGVQPAEAPSMAVTHVVEKEPAAGPLTEPSVHTAGTETDSASKLTVPAEPTPDTNANPGSDGKKAKKPDKGVRDGRKYVPSKKAMVDPLKMDMSKPLLMPLTSSQLSLQCIECHIIFSDHKSKERHLKLSHPAEYEECILRNAMFACYVCDRQFTNSTELMVHQKAHTEKKPFKCPICGIAFKKSSELTLHKKIHFGQDGYACTDCGKPCKTMTLLKYHRRTHTGERPYVCKECGKRFTMSKALQKHAVSHLPEGAEGDGVDTTVKAKRKKDDGASTIKYPCSVCKATFKSTKTRLHHMKTKHNGLPAAAGKALSSGQQVKLNMPTITPISIHQPALLQVGPHGPLQKVDANIDTEQIRRLIESLGNVQKVNQVVILGQVPPNATPLEVQQVLQLAETTNLNLYPPHIDFIGLQQTESKIVEMDPSNNSIDFMEQTIILEPITPDGQLENPSFSELGSHIVAGENVELTLVQTEHAERPEGEGIHQILQQPDIGAIQSDPVEEIICQSEVEQNLEQTVILELIPTVELEQSQTVPYNEIPSSCLVPTTDLEKTADQTVLEEQETSLSAPLLMTTVELELTPLQAEQQGPPSFPFVPPDTLTQTTSESETNLKEEIDSQIQTVSLDQGRPVVDGDAPQEPEEKDEQEPSQKLLVDSEESREPVEKKSEVEDPPAEEEVPSHLETKQVPQMPELPVNVMSAQELVKVRKRKPTRPVICQGYMQELVGSISKDDFQIDATPAKQQKTKKSRLVVKFVPQSKEKKNKKQKKTSQQCQPTQEEGVRVSRQKPETLPPTKPKTTRKRKASSKVETEGVITSNSKRALECKECGQRFSDVSSLQKHKAVHIVESPGLTYTNGNIFEGVSRLDLYQLPKRNEKVVGVMNAASDWDTEPELAEMALEGREQSVSFPALIPSPSLPVPSSDVETKSSETGEPSASDADKQEDGTPRNPSSESQGETGTKTSQPETSTEANQATDPTASLPKEKVVFELESVTTSVEEVRHLRGLQGGEEHNNGADQSPGIIGEKVLTSRQRATGDKETCQMTARNSHRQGLDSIAALGSQEIKVEENMSDPPLVALTCQNRQSASVQPQHHHDIRSVLVKEESSLVLHETTQGSRRIRWNVEQVDIENSSSPLMESGETTRDESYITPEFNTNQCIFYPVKEEEREVLLGAVQTNGGNLTTGASSEAQQTEHQETDSNKGSHSVLDYQEMREGGLLSEPGVCDFADGHAVADTECQHLPDLRDFLLQSSDEEDVGGFELSDPQLDSEAEVMAYFYKNQTNGAQRPDELSQNLPTSTSQFQALGEENRTREPIDYFSSYFGWDTWVEIANCTNKLSNTAKLVTAREVAQFVGIHIAMGTLKFPSPRLYWEDLTKVPLIAEAVPLSRFLELSRMLKLASPAKDPVNSNVQEGRHDGDFQNALQGKTPSSRQSTICQHSNGQRQRDTTNDLNSLKTQTDPLWKAQPLLCRFKAGCQTLRREGDYAVDQYPLALPGKMHNKKLSLNCTTLIGFGGLLLHVDLKLGLSDQEDAVEEMAPKGSMVFLCKQELSTPAMLERLLVAGVHGAGRVGGARGQIGDEFVSSDGKLMLRRSHCGFILSTAGQGQRNMASLIDNFEKAQMSAHLNRDLQNLYSIPLTASAPTCWPQAVLWYLTDLALVNSWLLYRQDHRAVSAPLTLMSFRLEVSKALILCSGSDTQDSVPPHPPKDKAHATNETPNPSLVEESPMPDAATRYDGSGHWPEQLGEGEGGRCRFGDCQRTSRVLCLKCCVFLCISRNHNCFLNFHNQGSLEKV